MLFAVSAIILIMLIIFIRRCCVPAKHRWRRRQARAMALQLSMRDRLQPPQLLYARLRAMDPLAFEELLLESFERRGCKVVRDQRYAFDGGIDGRVVIDGVVWLIQVKRYAGAIRPDHVAAFELLCRARGQCGLFIHSGRTGPKSGAAATNESAVEIISGPGLLALLTDGRLPGLAGGSPHAGSVSIGERVL